LLQPLRFGLQCCAYKFNPPLRGAGRHASSISPYPVQAVARLGYTSISTSDARIFGEKGLRAAQY
ncbi:hypothetical protein, partial [Olsenella sp. AGMB03486]|uniref:hypothetical protein n=1 Tax=Olsenella sp. AGMB03486 TaxID=3230364 RepID=UPI0034A052F8